MIEMVELVGKSTKSFSDAVENIVHEVKKSGQKVFWFEVNEQRGALRGDEIEYQVKLKVAVEK